MANLIYDWNIKDNAIFSLAKPTKAFFIHDETLRDGLQSPSVTIPNLNQKCELIRLMPRVGIDSAGVGFPASNKKVQAEMRQIAKTLVNEQIPLHLTCLARPIESDIAPIVTISQDTGVLIEPFIFVGSSPVRQQVEGWSIEQIVTSIKQGIRFAIKEGLSPTCFTEDTTRTAPADLEKIYLAAVELGAKMIGIADTTGHATPVGVFNLIVFIRNLLDQRGFNEVKIDFHSHMDRGLGLINSLAALSAGADRIHGCALGVGERSGNAPIDQILINLKLMGWIEKDLRALAQYCALVSTYFEHPIPVNYPVFGKDAFRTSTGIHAAAVIKAAKKSEELSDLIYSGIPASWFDKEQVIVIGSMSGKAGAMNWLQNNNYQVNEDSIVKILTLAKRKNKILTDEEIKSVL